MVSKKVILVIGLNLTVYGLEEYLLLDKKTPVSVMFALHGRLQNQSKMEHIAQNLCRLNKDRKKGENHILVITFDVANHGSRMVDRNANFVWFEGEHQNQSYAINFWAMNNSSSSTVSQLIDILDYYLFDPNENCHVQVWGVLGFSMSGYAALLTAASDPRITVAIPIAINADFVGLVNSRLEKAKLSIEMHFPKYIQTLISIKMENLDEKLKTKHILILNGANDHSVKAEFNEPLIQSLRKIHVGKEGIDWKFRLIAGMKHEWVPEITEECIGWTYQWMIRNISESKL